MVQSGQITFYTYKYSPYAHRVHIALEEAKADYTPCFVDIKDKPAWYAAKVNPDGRVPAIIYAGPKAAPEDPSPEAAKINESLVILEFLADLFPEAHLLPSDPVLRARARLFINAFQTNFFEAFKGFFAAYSEGADARFLEALEALQARLPSSGFVTGNWSNADIVAVPFLMCMELLLKNDIGQYPAAEGPRLLQSLQGPKFARLRRYIDDIKQRPSVRETWNEVSTA
ncbi:thioredoxin-like protein [Trametes punicea]|nr:thioredoxin-like protein [Trametes punicea]